MTGRPDTTAPVSLNSNYPAANTDAVITKAAATGVTHVCEWISCSYNATATTPTLVITDDSGTIWDVDLPVAVGYHHFTFPGGLYAALGSKLVITLLDGGGAVTGKLNAGIR